MRRTFNRRHQPFAKQQFPLFLTLRLFLKMGWYEDTYECGCGFGSRTGARAQDLINHVRGCHCIDVTTGISHFAYCNDCPRQNGHGRRLNNMDAVIDHLEAKHGVEILFFDYN
jgi:hypothetical protein